MAQCFSQGFAQRSSDGAELSMCRATCRNTRKKMETQFGLVPLLLVCKKQRLLVAQLLNFVTFI